MNKIMITGILTRDIEVYNSAKTTVGNFTLANDFGKIMRVKELLETGTITKDKPESKSKYTTKELYERIEELYVLANEITDRVKRL